MTDSMFLFVCVFVRLSDCGSDNETIEVFNAQDYMLFYFCYYAREEVEKKKREI